jgi:septum formation protein
MISSPKKTCQNKVMLPSRRLVLASTSPYRRELLTRLGVAFEFADPAVAEDVRAGESPAQTAERLAHAKAAAVRARYDDALIVGADQVACCGDLRLDKPRTHDNAVRQLAAVSGKLATFDTAVVLLDARSGRAQSRVVRTRVRFRPLSAERIDAYLRREQPYDCAGSARAEGLGIALIARIESDDPTALIGLPLVALTEMLADAGAPVLPA